MRRRLLGTGCLGQRSGRYHQRRDGVLPGGAVKAQGADDQVSEAVAVKITKSPPGTRAYGAAGEKAEQERKASHV